MTLIFRSSIAALLLALFDPKRIFPFVFACCGRVAHPSESVRCCPTKVLVATVGPALSQALG